MPKEICIECKAKDAVWVRWHEFVGKSYYCDECAKLQLDFGVPRGPHTNSYFWQKINKKEVIMCTKPILTDKAPVNDSIKSKKKSKHELYEEIVKLLKEAIFGVEV